MVKNRFVFSWTGTTADVAAAPISVSTSLFTQAQLDKFFGPQKVRVVSVCYWAYHTNGAGVVDEVANTAFLSGTGAGGNGVLLMGSVATDFITLTDGSTVCFPDTFVYLIPFVFQCNVKGAGVAGGQTFWQVTMIVESISNVN